MGVRLFVNIKKHAILEGRNNDPQSYKSWWNELIRPFSVLKGIFH